MRRPACGRRGGDSRGPRTLGTAGTRTEVAFGRSPKLKSESIENLTRIHGKKCWLQLHQDGRIAALMLAYWLQLHPKDQHFHGDEILESLVEGLEANSLVVEHLEIWEEIGHMVGGFLEDQKD